MMGVIKAKNSAGEWVNVASAEATTIHNELMGIFKMETVEYGWGEHKQSLDLSTYVGANDNFIIILELSSSKNDGTSNYFLWHKEDGLDHALPFRASGANSTSLTNGIFAEVSGSDVSVSYDETAQTLSLIDDTYKWIYSFTILYAGVKEA
jgi:hypothetical protein